MVGTFIALCNLSLECMKGRRRGDRGWGRGRGGGKKGGRGKGGDCCSCTFPPSLALSQTPWWKLSDCTTGYGGGIQRWC